MTRYTIQRGDTLTRIASRFNVTVEAIAQANGIKNVDVIKTGAVLDIPAAAAQTPTIEKAEVTLAAALEACVKAVEALPEFKQLEALVQEEVKNG